jgi:hypothetical protein
LAIRYKNYDKMYDALNNLGYQYYHKKKYNLDIQLECNHYVCVECYPKISKIQKCPKKIN